MNQFTFDNRQKTLFGAMMLIGIISMVITWMGDDAYHTRFWSNLLHNFVFLTGTSLMALFMLSASITAWAGWYTVIKRVWEAYSLFLIVGLVFMLIIAAGIWGGWHHLYHWADLKAVAEDEVLKGKSSFLNRGWYTFGTILFMGVWIWIATRIRALSLDQDKHGDANFTQAKKMRIWGAAALPVIGFFSAAMLWQWVMSVDAHWYSTMFAWYSSASLMVTMIALTIITLIALKIRGYFPLVNIEHLHDLGKYLFAFSIFWTYLWFDQFMLIWYANIPEETTYFFTRLHHYTVLFYLNIVLNFALPFLVLLRNDTKRKYGTLMFISCVLVFSHWLDFFLMFKPGILHTAQELASQAAGGAEMHHGGMVTGFTIPGFPEIGTFIGFLGVFFYFVFGRMAKASLVPSRDPYLLESVTHHV